MTFIAHNSIVRKIWGSSDTILFIFAGAAAEFALNKSVDWLYFTGKLPNAPIDRLLSTVDYARNIIFSEELNSRRTIDKMTQIHKQVEEKRGWEIPASGYRDVLYLLIYYSIAAFELLERKLDPKEKTEVFAVFLKVGQRMELKELPTNYDDWLISRKTHLETNLISEYKTDLYQRYRKKLGLLRYFILLETQKMLVPETLKIQLGLDSLTILKPCLSLYKIVRQLNLHKGIQALLLPTEYKARIAALDMPNAKPQKRGCPFH